jgi:hypothetical protein
MDQDKKICLLIQGHTKYIDQMLDHIEGVKYCIWSTDSGGFSKEDLIKLKKNKIIPLTSSYNQDGIEPLCSCGNPNCHNKKNHGGYGNINLQLKTVQAGLVVAKQFGMTHVIKTRSDLIFTDTQQFIEKFTGLDQSLTCLTICRHLDIVKNFYYWIDKRQPDFGQYIKDFGYTDIVEHYGTLDYIADFCIAGPISEMIKFWSYPIENKTIKVAAEYKLMLHYCRLINKKIVFDAKYINGLIPSFINILACINNPMISFKRGWDTNSLLNDNHGDISFI